MQELITRFTTEDKVPSEFTHAGRAWHSIRFTLPNGSKPETMSALVIGPVKAVQSHAATFGQMFHLTPRETEALELFMKGFSVKEAAARMKISSSTAKAFLRLITIKMGVSGRAEMMSNVLSYMCAASLTCPFRTSLPVKARTSQKD
jgi:DNA-binding CsgD family transcriptional regulator